MRIEDKLLEKTGREHGMKVPDGYFEEFSAKMMEKLPEYPARPEFKPLSRWQRIKPYVYMAAMFMGIWCMMKMFHIASQNAAPNLDNPPEAIAQAMSDDEVYEYFYELDDNKSEFEYASELSTQYDNMADFEKDFGYELSPEYASINLI